MQLTLFDFSCTKISLKEARSFFKENHYLKGCSNGGMYYGRYKNGILVACVSFNVPVSPGLNACWLNDHHSAVFELTRLALSSEADISASQFVSESIKQWMKDRERLGLIKPRLLISYADSGEGHHGGVYQSMSWLFCGISPPTTNFIDLAGRKLHRRINGRNRQATPFLRAVKGSVKFRYCKLLGSSKMKRHTKRLLKYKVLDYPKPAYLTSL